MKPILILKTLAFALLLCLLNSNSNAQIPVLISEWNGYTRGEVPESGKFPASGGISGNKDRAILTRGDTTAVTYAVNADQFPSSNAWENGQDVKCWMATFSTQGYENLTLTSKQQSSSTGPRDFKIQYKVGDGLWSDLTGGDGIVVATNMTGGVKKDIALPAGMEDQAEVSLRWICTSGSAVNGSVIKPAGTSRLNLVIDGEAKVTPSRVDEAMEMPSDASVKCWVLGYIAGGVNTSNGTLVTDPAKYRNTNLALAGDPVATIHMSLQLPAGDVRNALNIVDNPENIGKPVWVYGTLEKYCGIPGIKNVTGYRFVSGPLITVTPSPVQEMVIGTTMKLKVTAQNLTGDISIRTDDESKAGISATSLPPNAGQTEVRITAKAAGTTHIVFTNTADNVETKVKVNIIPPSSDASLKTLKIGNETIRLLPGNRHYIAKPVSFKTESVLVTAVPFHPNAKVIRGTGNLYLQIGENTLNVEVIAEDGARKVYSVTLIRNCAEPAVTQQMDPGISGCKSGNRTLEVKATGDALTYQWFFEGDTIYGATSAKYIISGLKPEDYGQYHVVVSGACGLPVKSEETRLWVADPLPETLLLNAPDTAYAGQATKVSVGYSYGYADVSAYKWSFSKPSGASFYSSIGENSPVMYVTFEPQTGSGTLRVNLNHVCGNRTVSRSIRVLQRNPAAIDHANENAGIRIYPNPVTDVLNIQSPDHLYIRELIVTDVNGRIRYHTQLPSKSHQLQTGNWEKGVYLIIVNTPAGSGTYQIIKK